ncbi:hypothetical protein HK096_008292, partial [Nowakowskiella sp. JEL0078]
MAKSLRSKSKRKFRSIKRTEVFAPIEDARLERLAQKQADIAENSEMNLELKENERGRQRVEISTKMEIGENSNNEKM